MASLRRTLARSFTGLWRDPEFMKLWSSMTITAFGAQITNLALPLTAAVMLSATPMQMGILVALETLPFALVSLHASAWASGFDCVSNTMASLDVAAEARKTADFLAACGAGAGGADLITFDLSDRDAAWYDTQGRDAWLDASDTTLPTFAQAFRWSAALTARLGLPGLWWQVPVGNRFMPNRCDGWQDNKVDYFLDHPDRVAASGAVGAAFGAGASCQTSPETDGGRLAARAGALQAVGGLPLCP